ncbi:hypothetical protein SPRG_08544 [Saprolegnia parasitica CBS 223.65]|uniref:EF-hand domain-containing protein n=1 Tax=Saprolegnia parasitica (strain CBS 223.65) TaxID=695850 RepID=A0A067CHD2_SAPPC|nr:hypothetical protein SPRG_08544 [Saprolegnia parasitica CBS 223.65]KDO26182.1 hypothetical protein SPRG_08544 [Saprolegnia parasitica CBS 223.65]|eukprot:XP_012203175.1 hypothetical protein SPRG_08544 [Saprolegnia parasitica CBS 223.65]
MAAHGTLDENIQLTRVFRTLTIEIPEKRLTRKLLSLESKMAELRANGSDANALEMKRLDAKWATTQSERQQLREVAQQDASLFARSIERTALFEVYEKLGYPKTMTEVEDLIWEVNDGLNGAISWNEYERSFERCKADKSCLEPSDLFYLTCFLMYDRDVNGKVSMDDAMHILFLKHGNNMEDEMTALFGKSHSDDYINALSFRTFAQAIDRRRSEIIDHSGLTNRLPGKKGAWKGHQQ